MHNKTNPRGLKKVVFIFGGPSSEHDVSCSTAKSALPAFESDFELLPIYINRQGNWVVAKNYVPAEEAWPEAAKLQDQPGLPAEIALDEIERTNPFVVFLGLHGEFGEDGTIQALLEAQGLSYVGSDAEASALAMDKPKVLELLQNEDFHVPEFLEIPVTMNKAEISDFIHFYGLPIVVLPADRGSSVGVTLVKDEADIMPAIDAARKFSDRVLLTQYIKGREVSAGVLAIGKNELVPLPPTEIIPGSKHEFFDYNAKYLAGESEEVTPPNMPADVVQTIQKTALAVHKLVGADGYSRVDMIVAPNNQVFVLEINTLPGMTATSIIPQEAKVYGLNFGQFLTTLCENVDQSAKD